MLLLIFINFTIKEIYVAANTSPAARNGYFFFSFGMHEPIMIPIAHKQNLTSAKSGKMTSHLYHVLDSKDAAVCPYCAGYLSGMLL